ncbi:DUF1127 domain-containing protein [Bradyrhizobium sp. NBAIM08]|uniref:DUF1127 domain-containing protein n=1 Tax=Bradyrhizobium sp. NBAIM08 TaxID=2793815 RepID=UPI001CD45F8E|nr:DUF1127 domain-containing protein [Bradyrhizobium sp. NBAIM08]
MAGVANLATSSIDFFIDVAQAAGRVLVSEFLAGCAAYACAMYPCGALLERSEGPVEPGSVPDQSKSDGTHEVRPKLRLIARHVSPPVEEAESHRLLLDVLPFTSDIPPVGATVRSFPTWYALIGAAALALCGSIRKRWEIRRALAEVHQLDDRLLRDIGVCRGDIENAVKGDSCQR